MSEGTPRKSQEKKWQPAEIPKDELLAFRQSVSNEAFTDDGDVIAPDPEKGTSQYFEKFRRPQPLPLHKWRQRQEEIKEADRIMKEDHIAVDASAPDMAITPEGDIKPSDDVRA